MANETRNYHYLGCFVSPSELLAHARRQAPDRLARVIRAPHVTVRYRPDGVDEALFGTPVTVRVTGYGCDGANEGYRVETACDVPALAVLLDAIPVPHITISIGEEARAVDTAALEFQSIEPFELQAVYGGYLKGEVVLQRPEMGD